MVTSAKLNMLIGGETTPAVVKKPIQGKAKVQLTMKPVNTTPAGSNAASAAYGKAMNKAFKEAKSF